MVLHIGVQSARILDRQLVRSRRAGAAFFGHSMCLPGGFHLVCVQLVQYHHEFIARKRTTVSVSRTHSIRRLDASTNSKSPATCPCESLSGLKLSRSRTIRARWLPLRLLHLLTGVATGGRPLLLQKGLMSTLYRVLTSALQSNRPVRSGRSARGNWGGCRGRIRFAL